MEEELEQLRKENESLKCYIDKMEREYIDRLNSLSDNYSTELLRIARCCQLTMCEFLQIAERFSEDKVKYIKIDCSGYTSITDQIVMAIEHFKTLLIDSDNK